MENSVCFIGHRKIKDTPELKERLETVLFELIKTGIVNFIFGDHSQFNDLCYKTVTELKEKYPAIKRIHFRKDYEDTNDYTMQFLISGYEESIYPKGVSNSGRLSYIKRNEAMIRESNICVFYYDENYRPANGKNNKNNLDNHKTNSGTGIAFNYAKEKQKTIINCF